MAEELLEAATPERCLRDDWRRDLGANVSALDHLPLDSRTTPLCSNLIAWQRFGMLLWQAFEHRSGYQFYVCSLRSSNPPIPIYQIHVVTL